MSIIRAQLQALVQAYDEHGGRWPESDQEALFNAVARARTQLAQPEGKGLTDEELLELMPQQFRDDLATVSRLASYGTPVEPGIYRVSLNTGALDFARAAIAADRASRPTPQPPADGEVAELVEWLHMLRDRPKSEPCVAATFDHRLTRAAELLEAFASDGWIVPSVLNQHPQPVPVAIPGEEYHEDMGPVTWWRLPVEEPPWVGTPHDSDWPGYHTHFTPAPPEPCNAAALPVPTSEGDHAP